MQTSKFTILGPGDVAERLGWIESDYGGDWFASEDSSADYFIEDDEFTAAGILAMEDKLLKANWTPEWQEIAQVYTWLPPFSSGHGRVADADRGKAAAAAILFKPSHYWENLS